MFGTAWPYLVFGTLIPAILLREPTLSLISLLLFLTGGLSRLWDRYLFSGVGYTRTLSQRRVFFGEQVTLQVHITNQKILPLPWFRVEEEVPDAITFTEDTRPAPGSGRRFLSMGLSLRWYNKITRRYVAQCNRRGSFQMGPAQLEAGDLFGFFRRSMTVPETQRILVYPRVVPLESLGIASRELFGDVRVRRHISEDPARILGTREYAPSDPMKRIHWKSTARIGRLQTKVLEPVTSVDVAIFLDTRTVDPPYWGYVDELLELDIIVATAVANYASQHDIRAGLFVNQASPVADRAIRIPPSSDPAQLARIMEALAQLHAEEMMPIARLVQLQGKTLPWNTTLMVITAVPTPALLSTLAQFYRAGRKTALVLVGRQASAFALRGLPTFRVDDGTAWRAVQSISIQEV